MKHYDMHCKSDYYDTEFTVNIGDFKDRAKAHEFFFLELTCYKIAKGDIFELIERGEQFDIVVQRIEI